MKYKKKYIDIINKLRNKKELNFISGLLKKKITLKFESFVPKLKNNFKKSAITSTNKRDPISPKIKAINEVASIIRPLEKPLIAP